MIQTERVHKAISFAATVHNVDQHQTRKGKEIPYLSHPLMVAILLASIGADDALICAGILHDTIEDSTEEHKVDFTMLEARFGTRIAQMVLDVTETDKSLPWEARKHRALEQIATVSHDSLLVKSADVITNQTELIADYNQGGEAVFALFKAPKELTLAHTLLVIEKLIESWPENPLIPELERIKHWLLQVQSTA